MNAWTRWYSPVTALTMLGLAWLAWRGAGSLVERFGLPVGGLLQQAVLFALFLTASDRLAVQLIPSDPPRDHHG